MIIVSPVSNGGKFPFFPSQNVLLVANQIGRRRKMKPYPSLTRDALFLFDLLEMSAPKTSSERKEEMH